MMKKNDLKNELLHCPSVAFEAATGVRGISGQYHYPQGRSRAAFERYAGKAWSLSAGCYSAFAAHSIEPAQTFIYLKDIAPRKLKKIQDMWKAVSDLNLDLNNIRFDQQNPLSLRSALTGVASRFHADDIEFYISFLDRTLVRAGEEARLDPRYNADLCAVAQAAGQSLGWVPAPQTLQTIKAQLGC